MISSNKSDVGGTLVCASIFVANVWRMPFDFFFCNNVDTHSNAFSSVLGKKLIVLNFSTRISA